MTSRIGQETAEWKEDYTFMRLDIVVPAGATVDTVIKPMLVEGEEARPYQPYFTDLKHSYFKGVKSTGRNLIPIGTVGKTGTVNGITYEYLAGGGIRLNGTATGDVVISNALLGIPNWKILAGTYTVSGGSSWQLYVQIKVIEDDSISLQDTTGSGYTYTFNQDYTARVNIRVRTGQTCSNIIVRPMLNIGSTVQPFGPYVEELYQLPQTLELMKYDSFNPQTGEITRATNRIVFTGNERFTLQSINANGFANFLTDSPLSDALSGDNPEYIICNQYEWDSNLIANVTKNGVFLNTSKYLFFRDNRYTTLDEWKAHLAELYAAGTPLIVEYELATHTIETVVNAPKSYTAYNQGTETVVQGETDNSVYGAIPTITTTYKIHENPTEVANKAYVNNGLAKKLDKTGGTITGNLIVENGTSTTLPALVVKNNEHTFGLALEDDTYKLGTGKVEDGVFTFDEGECRPVALRDDSENFENEAIPVWNSEGNYFKSSGKTIDDIPQITVDGVTTKTLKIYVNADGYLCIDTQ